MKASLFCYMSGFTLVKPASWWERLWMRRGGWVFLGWGHREGWSGDLPLYAHDDVVDYPHGYEGRLG